jgi:arabinosaccharide transport system substrate-binding protein
MKKLLALILMATLVLSLAACGGGETTQAPSGDTTTTTTEAAEPTTVDSGSETATDLSFWTFQELHNQFMIDAVESWNEQNPDRAINLTVEVYSYDELHSKLQIALQTGTGAPDLADIEISKYANFLMGNTVPLVSLNDVIEPEKENLIMGRFENYAKDGQYYGIDYHVGATATYYNTEIMEAAGVDIDAINTWDDYVEAGKKVKAETGKYMMAVETTEHWSYYPLLVQKGSDFFTDTGDVIIDNETNVEVLQWLHDRLYQDEIAVKAPGGFFTMPLWYLGRFTDYMPDLAGKMAVRPMPVWEEGGANSAGMGGTGTSVTIQCENPDLAKDFLFFSKISKEGAIKTWSVLGFDPLRKDLYDDPQMTEPNKYTEYFGDNLFDVMLDTADSIGKIVVTDDRFPNAVSTVQKNVMFRVLEENSQTPAEALTEAAEEIRAMS